jgi:hypothetical protein
MDAAETAEADAMAEGMLQALTVSAALQTAARDCCVPRTLSETSGSIPFALVGAGAA